jgi:protoporphyrinogen oxidase
MDDAIVIGGGLSGAVFAHHFVKKGSVLILEKDNRPGGAIHTVFPFENFFAELGAHTVYRGYASVIKIIDELIPFSSVIPHKNHGYFIKHNNKVSSVFSQLSYFGLLKGAMRLPFWGKEDKSVQEFYSVFGKNYERVLEPALSAIICQDSSEIAADVIMKRRRLKAKRYPYSFTLKGGISSLINAIVAQNGITLETSAAAARIIQNGGGYTVITADGREYNARHLAVATDTRTAAELLNWADELAGCLKSIPLVYSKAFLFAAEKIDYTFPLFGYIISRDRDFRGMVSRDPVNDDRYRAATLHVLDNVSPIEEFKKLKELFKISESATLCTMEERFCLPRLLSGHKKRAERMEGLLKGIKNLHLLGNFFGGLSMEDCAIRAENEAINV